VAWDVIASNWAIVAGVAGVLVAVLRPWRFWRARVHESLVVCLAGMR
jgi:hypothetical protein